MAACRPVFDGGLARVSPTALVASICEPAWDLLERSVRLRTLRRLQRVQWYPAERLAQIKSRALQDLVVHAAATSPFHARRFRDSGIDPSGVREISDLAGLPLLTKQDVRQHLDAMVSNRYDRGELVEAKTGGSTGVALKVVCDRAGIQKRAGAALLADTWSGWSLGQPTAAIWGNPPVPRTWRNKLRRYLKDRVIYLDTMKIDDEAIDRFVAQWRRLRPGLLYGHAHSLFIFAEAIAARGLRLQPRGIVATSMMLLQSEEVSLIACECEQHRGMHFNPVHAYVEILREDSTPCAAGEDGNIVVTELVNHGMPMLRYAVGDRGIRSGRQCPCGREIPLLEALTGRTADFLLAADNSRVAGISLIENTLTALPGIRQMQLVQERRLELTVNIVRGADYGPATQEQLAATLRGALGETFAIAIEFVDKIPQERSGKYRFAICTV